MSRRVRRDPLGVPHLWADDVMELARLQGQVTALDRAWQVEHHRWRTEGRTAEHVGPSGLPWDRFARQVRLEPTVRRCFEGLDAETRGWLTAYVDGVNDALAEGLSRAPEIRSLGLEAYAAAPRPWQPWTPLGIFWGIHLLFGTFPAKLFNAHVAQRLGPHVVPLLRTEGSDRSGSNAWVVAGHRTASGLPLLAGDPHRTIELPGCYQQVGLACPELDVVGFTFPGVPGVQHFAHTGSVAWGITNAMADYQDLTTEQLEVTGTDASGAGGSSSPVVRARGLHGWEPADASTEVVRVRDGADVEVPVVVTRRGPVVTGLDAWPSSREGRTPTYSLRTPTGVEGDLGFSALLPLLRSRTVADVEAALSRWVEPVNSALVADTSGRVRHVVAGRVPERDDANLELPVPAWDPRHVWHGYRTPPATHVDDVMVSANDRASGGGLGVDYATPFRAERIRELVGGRTDLTVDDFAAIHVDTLNGQAAVMRPLVAAVDEQVLGEAGARVRRDLLDWDGRSDVDSHGAALFAAWRTALVHRLAQQPALDGVLEPIGHSTLFAAWTDPHGQVGAGWHTLVEGAGAIGVDVGACVRGALHDVATTVAPVAVWGDTHRLDPLHALDAVGQAPVVPGDPVPGDKGCVLAAASAPGLTDRAYGGPVARYVWDLSDRAASRWVVPFGASGVASDDHFDDQTTAWLEGRLHPVHDERP